jgi:hypothetical protein
MEEEEVLSLFVFSIKNVVNSNLPTSSFNYSNPNDYQRYDRRDDNSRGLYGSSGTSSIYGKVPYVKGRNGFYMNLFVYKFLEFRGQDLVRRGFGRGENWGGLNVLFVCFYNQKVRTVRKTYTGELSKTRVFVNNLPTELTAVQLAKPFSQFKG